MLVKILGFLDIIAALSFISFIFYSTGLVSKTLFVIFAFYLILKGLAFSINRDKISLLDILCGLLAVFFLVIPIKLILIIGSIYILQKGVFSLL